MGSRSRPYVMLHRTLQTFAVALAIAVGLPPPAVAQEGTVTLRGVVYDAATAASIAEAAVFVAPLGAVAVTTETGAFALPVTPDTHVLTIRKHGYVSRSFRVVVAERAEREVDIGAVPLELGDEPVAPLTGSITSFGARVARASVVLNGRLAAIADAEGRFAVGRVELGPNVLEVRRIGYRPTVLHVEMVDPGAPVTVTIALDPVPLQLEEIVIDAEHTIYATGRIRDFYRRRQRGMGHYFTRWEIERANPLFVSDLFRRVAGVRVTPGGFGRNSVTMARSSCAPALYVDGVRMVDAAVDDLVWPDVVQGIEIYNGPAGAPVEYGGLGADCGVILIWTR